MTHNFNFKSELKFYAKQVKVNLNMKSNRNFVAYSIRSLVATLLPNFVYDPPTSTHTDSCSSTPHV